MPSGAFYRLTACPFLAIGRGAWIGLRKSSFCQFRCLWVCLVFVSYPFTIFVLRWLKSQVKPCDLVLIPFDSAVIRSILSLIRIVQRLTLPVRKSCHCRQPSASPSFRGRFHISYSASSRIRSCIADSLFNLCAICDFLPNSLNRNRLRSLRCFSFLVMGV